MTIGVGELNADNIDLATCRSLLEVFPGLLTQLIQLLPSRVMGVADGPGRWSPQQVLAHLLQIEEASWIPRIHHFYHGLHGPVPLVQPERHVDLYALRDTQDLLQAFRMQRSSNLRALEALKIGPDEWHRIGQHQEAGSVTVGQLVGTWAMHDLDHFAQILYVVGHDGRRLVGPLSRYLRICQDTRA